jgi:hypothetical protein
MQLKPSAFQMAILWVVVSLLATACGPSVNCDDPGTPQQEVCNSSSGATGIYYRSGTSSFMRSYPGSSGVRAGFGKTGGGRSGFG